MKTKTKRAIGCIQLFAAICLSMAQVNAFAECGHCEGGENYIYWACDINHGPPCSTSETCLWESLPPGVYYDAHCVYTYVDAYNCKVDWWSGFTTSRNGVCQSDCSCILYGDPFEDHGTGIMCFTPDSCIGS